MGFSYSRSQLVPKTQKGMTFMKKRYLLVLCTLLAAMLVFAACGNDNGNGNGGDNGGGGAAGATPVTLRVGESLGYEGDFITAAGRLFTELHPHITIEFTHVEVGQANSQMAVDGPAGVGPDVFVAPHDQLGALRAGGLVLPVPAGRVSHVQGQVLPSAFTGASFDGVLYGYPIAAETYAIFYNRAHISSAEIPGTFDELITWTNNFNDANPGRFGFMIEPGNAFFTIIFASMDGNRLFGPSGTDASTPNMNTPAAIRGMEFMQQQIRPILDVPSGDLDGGFLDAAFEEGQVAMYLTGPWNIGRFVSAGIDLGIAPIPRLPGEASPPASFGGTRTAFVSAFSRNSVEAHMFAEFLTSPEAQQLRHEMTGALPSIPMQLEDPVLAGLLAQMAYMFPMPSIPEMSSFWGAMPAASANIWDGMDVREQLNMVNSVILGE
jgi:arabinogalactan oligomer/maltooligosaccharide transport system substrate-binding protein